jgi:hypothetical protein
MGLSIHYSGSIKDPALLPELINEVQSICESVKIKYRIFNTELPNEDFGKEEYRKDIYGIWFTPKDCEPVSMCFLSNGIMSNPANLKVFGFSKRSDYKKFIKYNSTKTQYAGIETHKFIIKLIKHLSEKYLKDFTLSDEGGYWESDDEAVLKKQFDRYNFLTDSFADAVENISTAEGESLNDYITRISEMIHKDNKKDE